MKIHQLPWSKRKQRQRVGRGTGSGRGKTSGRGMDGQNSRSGGRVRPGFEGGQNPYSKRIPKTRGFRRSFPRPAEIYTDQLNRLPAGSTVNLETLRQAGLLPPETTRVKLIKRGQLSTALEIELTSVSAGARQEIEAAGGRVMTKES